MNSTTLPEVKRDEVPLVVRSVVAPALPYNEYKQPLRRDFFHSCAYCTMSEAEAQAIRFTIDHYEPRGSRPDLENVYDNLMWTCDECNRRKGNRTPPAKARKDGFRFFRPDTDVYTEHFHRDGSTLISDTNTGWYSLEALDLNREALCRLRDLRMRLTECDAAVTAGILAISRFPIDRLPHHIRGPAIRAIQQLKDARNHTIDAIEEVLRDHAKSPYLDDDAAASERGADRARKLKQAEALYPGLDWRAPRKTPSAKSGIG